MMINYKFPLIMLTMKRALKFCQSEAEISAINQARNRFYYGAEEREPPCRSNHIYNSLS